MRKTKIVVTLGPKSSDEKTIEALIKDGTDLFRLNFSHGTYEEHLDRIKLIKRVREKLKKPVGILQDLCGPKIRVKKLKNGSVFLKSGAIFKLTGKDLIGDEKVASINYPAFVNEAKKGERIFLDDGLIKLKIININSDTVTTKVILGGILQDNKGVNFPDSLFSIPSVTEKDKKDLEFGLENGVDFVAISFVRKKEDVEYLKKLVDKIIEKDKNLPFIISKIEKMEAVKNIDGIIEISDGIMVARGDLGVETPIENVPFYQKEIIKKCNLIGKPVITATQILSSMVSNPSPTRAEISDIANAVLDGTDALMLSNETAIGSYPVESVSCMVKTIEKTEGSPIYKDSKQVTVEKLKFDFQDSIATASYEIAERIKAKLIITATESGKTARSIARFKPHALIFAITPKGCVYRALNLSWGVFPYLGPVFKSVDEILEKGPAFALKQKLVKKGDTVIITAGSHIGVSGSTNLLKISIV